MALIPPFFMDTVVAIGSSQKDGKKVWFASGFLYGDFVEKVDETTSRYRVYIVTNKHVLESRKLVHLRFNPSGGSPAREYNLLIEDQFGKKLWYAHPDPEIDLGVVPITVEKLREHGIQFHYFHSDGHVANRIKLSELGVTEGDPVYTLGFPMGLVGGERNYVVARHGTIARITDTVAGHSKEFLVDSLIFPGNSGGPVVIRPEFTHIEKTKSIGAAYLIGVVSRYIPYQDVAYSLQTMPPRPRVVFEDNSGLFVAIPIDYIQEIIAQHITTIKGEENK